MKIVDALKNIKGKRCVVTGGAGFIGSHIVDALLENNAARVVVIDNLMTGSLENIRHHFGNEAFVFAEADINDAHTIGTHFHQADVVFHQAALGSVPRSVENPPATDINNVHGFVNVLHLCRLNQVKKVVFASSSSVYGDDATMPKKEDKLGKPLSPYAVSKRADEMYARVFADLFDISVTGLRYFNVFGPRQNPNGAYAAVIPLFIMNLLDKKDVKIFGDGKQSRDFTYVENIVLANMLAAFSEKGNEYRVMNIGCGGSYSVNELFETIRKITASKSKAVYEAPRQGDIVASSADVSRAAKMIGYEPAIELEEGLKKTVTWFKANRNVFS
ncbi:MAG: LPS biosynthesis protein WbpP [Bacteroidetes bacterium HGW-Bacteroidetes-6]|jgi:UDP-N-acetylglucosamine 4-epimerase|nr:MAG: LPS biosynthesis protein WbpP [Bacteroidetes bacterium HGW-Bacteroidetes-6]